MATLLAYSNNFIDVSVSIPGKQDWRLTCYYGFPERNRRSLSWDLLRTLSRRSSLPWCCIGDFNDMASQRFRHPLSLINVFRKAIVDSGLIDLGMKGHVFTWEKSRATSHFVEERLDRAMANTHWIRMFGNTEVKNLEVVHSDHTAIFLNPLSLHPKVLKKFKFENSWILLPECKDMVKSGWEKGEGRRGRYNRSNLYWCSGASTVGEIKSD